MNIKNSFLTFVLIGALTAIAYGDGATPRPVPLTRPEMKQLLEDMKGRKPRIPLPELTAEDKAKIGENAGYENRLRYHYDSEGRSAAGGSGTGGTGGAATPGGGRGEAGRGSGGGGSSRDPDPKMSLDYAFKTELFWIVSRTNNCQYCLGHQESKLLRAGLKEEDIAALDGDWAGLPPAKQAAYALARKLTYEPHLIADSDLDAVRKHYTDLQILEMILSVSANNSTNRWKEGAGVPQSQGGGGGGGGRRGEGAAAGATATAERPATPHSYLTPTPEEFQKVVTKTAPVSYDPKTGEPTSQTVCSRPPLESRAEVEQALAACRQRKPRLPLEAEAAARALLPADWPAGALPQWVRLLANFPRDGISRILSTRSADEKGNLAPLIKAQVSWIIARQDRAWYAAGVAKKRMNDLGWSDDQVYTLDGDWKQFTPVEQSLFTLARKLAATPVVLTDEDVDHAVKLAGPRDVVQMIRYTTSRAAFDRITEAAGLQLEN